MLYLGLGSDEDFQELHDHGSAPAASPPPAPQTSGVTTVRPIPKSEDTGQSRLANAVRTIAPPKVSKPCVVTPVRFSDVKEISEAIKRRQPVIVNIQQADHEVAVRVIDFCSGLKVGIDGGFVCQEVMDGFAKFWEVKSFWINGKFKYYIAMKASGEVFDISDINNPDGFGRVSPSVLKDLKKMGKKVVQYFPKNLNQYSNPPLYLRIDFGCCAGNKLDGKKYFLNEIEYAGCAIFSEESGMKNFTEMWGDAYYKKAKEFLPSKKTKKTKKRKKRSKKRNKKTKRK